MEREASLELLRNHHAFPGPFEFRVVIRPPDRDTIVSAVVAAGEGKVVVAEVTDRPSGKGTYVSLRIAAHVHSAETVLVVWDALKDMPEVIFAL